MQRRIHAVFMRGRTSRALFFREENLPTGPKAPMNTPVQPLVVASGAGVGD